MCVGTAFGLSGYFLFANVYPVLTAVSAAGPSNKCKPTTLGVPFSCAPGHSNGRWTDHYSLNNATNRRKPKSHVSSQSSYSFSTPPSQYVSSSSSSAPMSCHLLVAMTLLVVVPILRQRPMYPPLPQTYLSDPCCIDCSSRHHRCASLYPTVGSCSPPESD